MAALFVSAAKQSPSWQHPLEAPADNADALSAARAGRFLYFADPGQMLIVVFGDK